MKLEMIKQTLTRTAGRSGLILKKYSPEILMVVGVVGIVTSTVLACKATLKAEDVIENAKDKMDKIHQAKELSDGNPAEVEVYTQEDYKKDLTIVYAQAAWDFTKLYGPAITLGVASIGCILGAHGIMRKRNLALVAAYKAVEQSFSDYRKRVVAELGVEKDRQFKYGITKEKITAIETDENGKTKKVTKTIQTIDGKTYSEYARFFDEYSARWCKTPEYNLLFLKAQQNFANDLLNSRGHVFLNEVYEMLGIDHSPAGSVVGWVKGNGDDFIDFGLYDGEDPATRLFVNGNERSVLLDFNVDGIIYNLI
jgi:hypothetical protein